MKRISVHLDELEEVHVFVHEIIVKLQHVQFRELINSGAALIGSSDVCIAFALSDLEHTTHFLQVHEKRRPERFINQVFVGCESRSLVLCEVFDHLPIKRIFFELEVVSWPGC